MFVGRLVCLVLASSALVACGGSSSETPPPLDPHPMNLHYSHAATRLASEAEPPVAEADAGAKQQPRDVPEDEVDEIVPAAPRTWGSDRPPNK